MNILFYVVIGVYYISINVYGIVLTKMQKNARDKDEPFEETLSDGKLILTAFLGGALGILIGMFAMKYRLKSLILMVLLPVVTAVNIYILVLLLTTNNFGMVL